MTRSLSVLASILVTSLCLGCSGEDGEENPLDDGPGEFASDFATSDGFFTQMSEPAVGLDGSPHGVMQVWYSKNLEPATSMDTFTAPEGSVAIKTQTYVDGAYTQILVMVKLASGTASDLGDWQFEVRDTTGALIGPSDPSFCAGCHLSFADRGHLPGIDVMN